LARGTHHVTESCRPVTEILQLIGDKWTILVVRSLHEGTRRFSEIRRDIPAVSQRMLTLTLRHLEREGLVKRTVTPSIPPRVDYELTTLGRSLEVPLASLAEWAVGNSAALDAARAKFDAQQAKDRKRALIRA
jgi:DNA-binding HxlR family transcriptional regulator